MVVLVAAVDGHLAPLGRAAAVAEVVADDGPCLDGGPLASSGELGPFAAPHHSVRVAFAAFCLGEYFSKHNA